MLSGEVEGKIAIVTGSSSGIGKGIAQVLAREGADIVVNYNSNAEGAADTAARIEKAGSRVLVIQADVSKSKDVTKLIQSTLEKFGRIDILVNNAGISPKIPFFDTDEAFFETLIGTDFKGAYLCSYQAAQDMKKRNSGRIINITSIHDRMTSHHFSLYAAAKGGLRSYTQGLAVDLADHNITVNAVAPGWITIEKDGVMPQKIYDKFRNCVPLGHPGTPQDVGEIVSFLASDRSSWLTGQVIYLDGGVSCMIHMPSRVKDKELYNS